MSKDRMLKKGDNVVMHTCGEATFPKYYGMVWRCKSDEFITGEGKGLYEQRLVFLEGFSGSFATDYLQYIDLDLARSAPETTASPSETAADKGILTEEELKELYFTTNERSRSGLITDQALNDMYKICESHRNLLSANAELSFKNNELKKKFDKSLEWLETIETEFYHNTEAELERCRSQAKCAREELK